MKGLKPKDESEDTDSDKSWNESGVTDSEKSGNESEVADSVQELDSDESDQLKAKETRKQRKSMPLRRNQRIGKRRSHSSEGAEMGLLSRHADREGRGAQNQRGRGKRDRTGPDRTRRAWRWLAPPWQVIQTLFYVQFDGAWPLITYCVHSCGYKATIPAALHTCVIAWFWSYILENRSLEVLATFLRNYVLISICCENYV